MGKSTARTVASIIEKYTNFYPTDDLNVPESFIIDKMNDVRGTLIREDYTRKRSLQGYYSKTCCITVECQKPNCELNGITVYSGDVLWVAKLPALVGGVGEYNLKYLGGPSLNKDDELHRTTLEGFNNSEGNLWTSGQPMYTIVGDEAILKNMKTSGLSFLCAVGLFENPTSLCDWDKDEDTYPVVSNYKLEILVLQDLMSVKPIPKDMSQNTEETEQNVQIKQPQQKVSE